MAWVATGPKSLAFSEWQKFFSLHVVDIKEMLHFLDTTIFVDDGAARLWHDRLSSPRNRMPFHDGLMALMRQPKFAQLDMHIEFMFHAGLNNRIITTGMYPETDLIAVITHAWGPTSHHRGESPEITALLFNYDKISWSRLSGLGRRGRARQFSETLSLCNFEGRIFDNYWGGVDDIWWITHREFEEPNVYEWSWILLAMPPQRIVAITSPHYEHIIDVASYTGHTLDWWNFERNLPPGVSASQLQDRLNRRRMLALCSGLTDGYLVVASFVTSTHRFARIVSRLPPELHRVILGVSQTFAIEAIDVCWMASLPLVPDYDSKPRECCTSHESE